MRNGSRSWIGEVVEATRRVVAFGAGASASKPPRKARKPKKAQKRRGSKSPVAAMRKRADEVRKLAATGLDRREIARRTRLSQDTVGMLMNLTPTKPEESAGSGSFFRILQARMAV